MKTLPFSTILALIATMLFNVGWVAPPYQKATFTVYGNCGMCQQRIERAAMTVVGVKNARWSSETEIITVWYNSDKANLMTIHKAIAAAGHDTDKVRATDEAYNALHGCCKYNRPKKK